MTNGTDTAKKLLAEFKANYGDTGTAELDSAITGKQPPEVLEKTEKLKQEAEECFSTNMPNHGGYGKEDK